MIVERFVQNVYHILAGIDLSLEDAKKSRHMETSPNFIQDNNNVKSNEGAEVKCYLHPPRLAFAICGCRWQNDVHEIKYSVRL